MSRSGQERSHSPRHRALVPDQGARELREALLTIKDAHLRAGRTREAAAMAAHLKTLATLWGLAAEYEALAGVVAVAHQRTVEVVGTVDRLEQ